MPVSSGCSCGLPGPGHETPSTRKTPSDHRRLGHRLRLPCPSKKSCSTGTLCAIMRLPLKTRLIRRLDTAFGYQTCRPALLLYPGVHYPARVHLPCTTLGTPPSSTPPGTTPTSGNPARKSLLPLTRAVVERAVTDTAVTVRPPVSLLVNPYCSALRNPSSRQFLLPRVQECPRAVTRRKRQF